ncbi:MAG: thiol:disulfide interchange protein DsbA/DsbL [Luteimonas sp.]
MKRTALLLTLLLPLAACQQNTAATPAADAPAAASTTPSAAAEAAAAEAATSPATADASTSASAEAATAPADSTNTPAKPSNGFNATGALAPGVDYAEIQGGQPFEPRNGKIEVVEVFGYVCPACFRFQPLVSTWEKTLPADVRFTYVPAQFGPDWIPYAHAFYVSQSMGLVAKTHEAVFNAIHVAGTLPGEGKKPDEAAIAKFYGKYGADPKQFADAMHSFAIDAKLTHAKQFVVQSGVQGTPTMIVDGKYRVIGKSYDDMLRITNQLIAQERAAGAAHP